ncbi:polymer-forming cytoskeletal protein [Limnohabitans sp.]|jgi:cytoskeletal protein CcmA (bactofilin family)|uniref:bactofilin family protein n=1 Tax=Limnohabitans sp. TaxID=1907725 RepID=UPI00286F4C5D|nr:polymer-forming cytoskeletal protein [Limnohabitans sp.]
MFNKSKTNNVNQPQVGDTSSDIEDMGAEEEVELNEIAAQPVSVAPTPTPTPTQRNSMMDMITTAATKPSILSEGFSFRGEIAAKGAIHVEGALNGQIQVDELTIGARGQVEGVVTCTSLHIKGKFSGTATCNELIVTSSASVDGHVVYQTLSVQKGASIKGELLLVK